MSGTVIAQLLAFLLMPVLTRLYTQEAFGLLTSFSAMVSLISSYATLKYDTALVLPKKERNAYALLKLSNYIAVILICLSCAFLFLPIPYFKEYAGLQLFIAVGAAFSVNYNISALWNIRKKEFKITTTAKIMQSAGVFLFQLGFYFFFELKGLIIGNVFGVLFSGLYLFFIRKKLVDKTVINSITKDDYKKVAKRYIDFPKYFVWSNIILNLSSNLPVLLFVKFIPLTLLGLYGVALRLIHQPVALVSSNVKSIVLSYMAERKNKLQPILKWYLKIIGLLFILSLIGSLILIWKGETLVTLFLGKDWTRSGTIIKCMIPMFIGSMITTPATAAVRVFEMQKYTLGYSIVSLGLKVATLSILFMLKLEFELLILFYSMVTLLIILGNNFFIIKKIYRYEKSKKQLH